MTSIELDIGLTAPRRDTRRLSLGAWLAGFIAGWRKRRAQRLALQDLMAFSPYMLDDLGISADDIAAAIEQRAFEARRRQSDSGWLNP